MARAGNKIAQLGYVIPFERFDDCIAFWQASTGIGPFYVGDFLLDNQIYRGQPTTMGMRVALGYLGDMQIELIGQTDDQPSVYREWIERHPVIPRGGLYHHYFLLTDDYDDVAARLAEQGEECAFTASMPGAGRLILDGAAASAAGLAGAAACAGLNLKTRNSCCPTFSSAWPSRCE